MRTFGQLKYCLHLCLRCQIPPKKREQQHSLCTHWDEDQKMNQPTAMGVVYLIILHPG